MRPVTLVALADTHLWHDLVIPPGDVLVHAGDLTRSGRLEELALAADFLRALPHREKIVLAGNHDRCLERKPEQARALLHGLTYLEGDAVERCGLRFWGGPWQPEFCGWAFNEPRGAPLAARWAKIPAGLDVLLTHGPPLGYGDRVSDGRRVGCEALLARLPEVRPRVHLFGHIHEEPGAWELGPTLLVNVTVAEATLPVTVLRLAPGGGPVELVPQERW